MAKFNGNVTPGTSPQGDLGRGGMDAKDPGAGRTIAPLTTSTMDLRDKGHAHMHQHIAATRETPPVRPGKGLHDHSKMGGQMAAPTKPMIGTAVREGRDKQGSVWKGFSNGTPQPKFEGSGGESVAAVRLTPAAPKSRGLHTVLLGG